MLLFRSQYFLVCGFNLRWSELILIKYASRMCHKILFLPLLANSNFIFTNIDKFHILLAWFMSICHLFACMDVIYEELKIDL